MMGRMLKWLEDRTGLGKICRQTLFERIPGGPRWRYVWGSTILFAIVVQFITGGFLWMAYSPSASTAWESVFHLQNAVPGGALLRGIHRWMADIMVVLLLFHLVQMVIDGAYRAPREFNYWLSLAMMGLVVAIARTGYLLPWDQEGLWGTRVAMGYVGVTPVVGDAMQTAIVGGTDYGHHSVTRFFALHAGFLPIALLGVMVLNFYLSKRQGAHVVEAASAGASKAWSYFGAGLMGLFTVLAFVYRDPASAWVPWVVALVFVVLVGRIALVVGKGAAAAGRETRLWPDQILRNMVACLALLAAVLFFVFWKGTELCAPADPSQPFNAARPDWYFMSLFQLLKLDTFSGATGTLMGAVVVPAFVATVFFLMPFIGRNRAGHLCNVVFLYLFIGCFVVLTSVAFYKDSKNEDYHAEVAAAHREAERVTELVEVNGGIPPAGVLELVYADPLTQGPKLYAQNCASCHAYGGHDGKGGKLDDEPSAPDLKGVGSQQWIEGLLTLEKYQSAHYFGNTKFKDEKMAEALEDLALEPADIAILATALSSEARLRSSSTADPEVLKEGFALMGEDELACTDCHKIQGEGAKKGPDLTGYMSREWLIDFIGDPAHVRFYGEDNDRMPNFLDAQGEDGEVKPGKLDEAGVGLIVDWLRGEWLGAGE
jgi:quinol-cytochrome oxidoreductase complex cytochrome b subunit